MNRPLVHVARLVIRLDRRRRTPSRLGYPQLLYYMPHRYRSVTFLPAWRWHQSRHNHENMRLWLIRETALARQYSKVPPERGEPDDMDLIWIPKSIVEHTTKRGDEHDVKLPDWFIEKNGL